MSEIRIRNKKNNPVTDIIIGLLIGTGVFMVFLCLSALVITKVQINSNYLFILIIISSAISSLFTSFYTSHVTNKNKLIFGVASSVILILMHFIIILCFNNSNLALKTYLIFPADIITALIGAIAGINLFRK